LLDKTLSSSADDNNVDWCCDKKVFGLNTQKSVNRKENFMTRRLSTATLALCVAALVFSTATLFVFFANAHPKEVHSKSIYDVVACIEDGTIVDQTLVWGISEIIVPHDPNNEHEMKVRTFVSIRDIDWVNCQFGS
jgi:hypothetical protein